MIGVAPTREHAPGYRYFSRWRWLLCLLVGHRETWYRVERGRRMERVSRCTRCGLKTRGRVSL